MHQRGAIQQRIGRIEDCGEGGIPDPHGVSPLDGRPLIDGHDQGDGVPDEAGPHVVEEGLVGEGISDLVLAGDICRG